MTVRCAIYTRKSTEEGLDQDFNSLDAQREACEAYVKSQKGLGWRALRKRYDDGGISGGTMDRPALKALLKDIEDGAIDLVIVYKVDRLTRSLMDFAKIIETFDANGASFVSVTQQFNTTTSMGRLTLNVLLSFAQFEREVTGERIRDKIAASKKKGMWMGGNLPLGYDSPDRKLIVNQTEAETVRHIFRRYTALGSVRALKTELDADGIVSKVRVSKTDRTSGGKPFARGALFHLLQNRIYIGEITHKDDSYPGQHEAIIDRALWDEAQATLELNRVDRKHGTNAKNPSLLTGILFDEKGNRLTPSHAAGKGSRRYRYYISAPGDGSAPVRLPAKEIENAVLAGLRRYLSQSGVKPNDNECLDLLRMGARRVTLAAEQIEVDLGDEELLTVPISLRRRGVETKLVLDPDIYSRPPLPDPPLMKVVARAYRWNRMLIDGEVSSLEEIALKEQLTRPYVVRVLKLAGLAPDIVQAIISGLQPINLTAEKLTRIMNWPKAWVAQRELLLRL